MKILICDDEKSYLNSLNIQVQEYMKNHCIACKIVAVSSPETILHSDMAFDIAFLDIQMKQVDGISLAKELKQRNGKTALFFVTSYREYQDDAMDLHAFRFYEKPFDVGRLYAGLDKAMEYIDGAYVDIFLWDQNRQQRILADDIMYLTRENRRVLIRTKDTSFHTKESFDEICQALPQSFFFLVHKSFFVNLHYINQYSYSEVFLTDGTRIPVAPRKQASFHKCWFAYLRRR